MHKPIKFRTKTLGFDSDFYDSVGHAWAVDLELGFEDVEQVSVGPTEIIALKAATTRIGTVLGKMRRRLASLMKKKYGKKSKRCNCGPDHRSYYHKNNCPKFVLPL